MSGHPAPSTSAIVRPGPVVGPTRDLPEPPPLRRMLGPSVVLAGLAIGSGEFVLWPYFKAGFVFFWACLLGIATQFFLNMEIARWTMARGESAVAGFVHLSRHWAPVFLVLNLLAGLGHRRWHHAVVAGLRIGGGGSGGRARAARPARGARLPMLVFLYSILWMNCRLLPRAVVRNLLRRLTLVWSTLFFGWFTLQAIVHEVWPALAG